MSRSTPTPTPAETPAPPDIAGDLWLLASRCIRRGIAIADDPARPTSYEAESALADSHARDAVAIHLRSPQSAVAALRALVADHEKTIEKQRADMRGVVSLAFADAESIHDIRDYLRSRGIGDWLA